MKSTESGGSKRLGQSLSRQCKFGAGRAHAPGMKDVRGALGAPAAPPRRPLSVHARPPLRAPLGHVGAASGPGRWSWSESCSDGSLSLTRCSCVTPRLCFLWGSLTLWRSRRAGLSMLRSPRLTSGPPPRPHAADQRSRERTRVSVIPGSLGNAIRKSILIKHRRHERL